MSFSVERGPGGDVDVDIRVPAGRKPWLAVWAVLSWAGLAAVTALFGIGTVAAAVDGWMGPWTVFPCVGALALVLVAPRVPGAWRLARWRLAGRERIAIRGGRLVAERAPAHGVRRAELDLTDGAFVGVVGDVDRFLVRATRWRSGRWFRRDDVPGLDVGSVRISTPGGAVRVGLSLSDDEAKALADEIAALPGFARDLSALTGRI